MLTKTPQLLKWCFPKRIWTGPSLEKHLYLTFDDGPIAQVTPWVLEILQQYDAKASFFCIGDNVQKHPDVFHQVISDGHSIGNHTYHHLKGWGCNSDLYIKDVLLAQKEFWKQGASRGTKGKGIPFRPPYGKMTPAQAKGLEAEGFSIIMWDILTQDYRADLKPEKIFRKFKRHVRSGSILVFHDSLKAEKNLKIVLPLVLEHFSKEGFEFHSI